MSEQPRDVRLSLLSEQLALNHLFEIAHALDRAWPTSGSPDQALLQTLHRACLEAAQHSSQQVRQFTKFTKLLQSTNLRHEQFLGLLIPLERCRQRGIVDHDFLGNHFDRTDLQRDVIPLSVACLSLRSAFNVGAVFRTAECLGLSHIHLAGYTATPEHPKTKKTSMGTETIVPWDWHPNEEELIDRLKAQGTAILALETSQQASSIYELTLPLKPSCLLLGNERYGLNASIICKADYLLRLPMYGQKNSLNVSNAFAIAASEIRRQWLDQSLAQEES